MTTVKIRLNKPVKVFQLTIGGYFPLPLAQSVVVLVDRNIISILKQIGVSHDRGDHEDHKWWFNFLNSSEYTLNPVLSAMEGKDRKTPTLEEFISEFELNSELLKTKLPNAKSISYTENNYSIVYEIVEKLLQRHSREVEFLVSVVPLIRQRVSGQKISKLELEILKLANNCLISPFSLVVLVVLSCLYDDRHGKIPNIGKKLIKPNKRYNENDAHNIISDLRYLEFLIAGQAFFGNVASFVTRDKALAAFWCVINAKNHSFNDNDDVSFDLELNTKLLPRLNPDEIDLLVERLAEYNL